MIALWWAACAGGDDEVPVVVPAPAAARPELAPFRGRWLSARRQQDGAWVMCAGGPSVELREEGNRWDLVVSMPDDLRILPIGVATPHATGLHLDANGAPVELTWVEPGRIASFNGLVDGQTFAAPGVAASLPAGPCGQ